MMLKKIAMSFVRSLKLRIIYLRGVVVHKLSVTKAFSTGLTEKRVAELADETGVNIVLVDSRFMGKGKWLNDFEVAGTPGKVAGFFERLDDVRRD
ncbi:MAG: hypothetical protein H6Q73_4158 [Firmicutes bacterium]|nr:hypothetical protein [Bacillota bacterium]